MPDARVSRALQACFALLVGGLAHAPAAAAQVPPDSTRLTVSGSVYDRSTGTPIAGARVRFAGSGHEATTRDDGRYALPGMAPGPYLLEVDAAGFRSLREPLTLVRSGLLNLALEPLSGSGPPKVSRIVGRVVGMETGDPLEGAEVTPERAGPGRISDARGRFEIGPLEPGALTLSVRYLGRAPLQASVEVPAEGTLEVEIRLAVEPIELEPMVVTATPRNGYLEQMGFYRRRDAGLSGTQITRRALEEANPRSLREVLSGVPGLRVFPSTVGNFDVRMKRAIRLTAGAGEGCTPALFMDDVRSEIGWLQDLDPARIEAIEIYTGANAPLRYNDPCGVILIWTRRGERRSGGG